MTDEKNEDKEKKSRGYKAVRLDFCKDDDVYEIKRMGAALIDRIEKIDSNINDQLDRSCDRLRCKEIAIREIESAIMWAVKAQTA